MKAHRGKQRDRRQTHERGLLKAAERSYGRKSYALWVEWQKIRKYRPQKQEPKDRKGV